MGAAPDLLGRDLKGKAVLVYSTFVPGGRSHSASDRAGLFNSDTLVTKAGAAMIINIMAVPGNGQFNPEGAPTGPDAVPTMTISQDEGFMLRDLLATGQKVRDPASSSISKIARTYRAKMFTLSYQVPPTKRLW